LFRRHAEIDKWYKLFKTRVACRFGVMVARGAEDEGGGDARSCISLTRNAAQPSNNEVSLFLINA